MNKKIKIPHIINGGFFMKKIIIILMSILSITACSTVKNTTTGAVEEYL